MIAIEEMRRRKTFDILVKWIAKKTGCSIQYRDSTPPCADPDTNTIFLPSNYKIENLDKIVAIVFHEAQHLKSSNFDWKEMMRDKKDMLVFNALEDARIDDLNIRMLPNMVSFYLKLHEDLLKTREEDKMSQQFKVLINMMNAYLGHRFKKFSIKEKAVEKYIESNNLQDQFNDTVRAVDYWQRFQKKDEGVAELYKLREILFGKPEKEKPTESKEQSDKPCSKSDAPSSSPGKSTGKESNTQEGKGTVAGKAKVEKQLPGGGFSQHQALFEPDPDAKIPNLCIDFTEQTAQEFKRLLIVKSTVTIPDGHTVDTEHLDAFFTGDIDSLFKEEKIVRHLKSKLILVLDASGSMGSSKNIIADGFTAKYHIARSVAKKLSTILDDLRQEGYEVDYLVRGFDNFYMKYVNWEIEYRPGGGTWLYNGFEKAHEEMLEDTTIDGKKIIIMLTDGDVPQADIKQCKDLILKTNQDVRSLVLGIGADTAGDFTRDITERSIISPDHANEIILGAIMDCLS